MPNFILPLTTEVNNQSANEAYRAVPTNGTLLKSDKILLKKDVIGSIPNVFINEYKTRCKIQINDKSPLFIL